MAQRRPKWRRNPAGRPQQILEAALEVFGQSGVANATLDEIADRAGVSKGTIYLYFPNKEGLFRETLRHALTPVSGADQQEPASASPTRQLLDTLSRQWAFLTSPLAVTVRRLVSAEQWQFPDLVELYDRETAARFSGELGTIIQRGIEDGEFRELDSKVAARMLTALIIKTAEWRETGAASSPRRSSDAVLRELAEFYLQGIAPTDAAFPQADGAPNLRAAPNN